MKHFEINVTVKDIQVLGGLSYTSSKILSQKVKKSHKLKYHQWLSLESFCSYLKVNYRDALAILEDYYDI
ncbi:hypothetical protein ABIE26_001586 [Pedobacter africanus]|uniref:Uncharacterized protein n=1 Tax=Pedobacter africanus TaxID=151894 RepID=A0ACC6KRW7_9SPHI|nr:hypothetical protein [Pedobacter africanus]